MALKPSWEVAWSRMQRRWFFQDRVTGKSTWLKPDDCPVEVPTLPPKGQEASHKKKPHVVDPKEDEDADLPPGWKSEVERESGHKYYYNVHTNARTWFKPLSEASEAGEDGTGSQNVHDQKPARRRARIQNDIASRVPWDHETYLIRMKEARQYKDTRMLQSVLMEIVESNTDMQRLIKKIQTPETSAITYLSCMKALMDRRVPDYDRDPIVSLSKRDTSEALLEFSRNPNARVCGLCFGDGTRPGGGYISGKIGQEEDLCRRIPNYYPSLQRAEESGCYPFGPVTSAQSQKKEKFCDVLYTPGCVIARGGEAQGFPILSTTAQGVCSIVNASPPMGSSQPGGDVTQLLCGTVTSMFVAPLLMDPTTTTLVLGAWGCGPEGRSATTMAHIFAQAIVGEVSLGGDSTTCLGRLYREIHFAIPKKSARSKSKGQDQDKEDAEREEDAADVFMSVLSSKKYKAKIRLEEG